MRLFEGLRFRPGNTFVHRLDPRAKLGVSILILTTAIIYVDVVVILTLLSVEAAVIFLAQV
ncbi:MAG: hypothetical protein QXG21_02535, partial [Candidatus Caldarchaeum sp.]